MTGDFTWEAWVYPTSFPAGANYETLWGQRLSSAAIGGPAVVFNSAGALLLFISNSAASAWAVSGFNPSLAVSLNQWQHIALVKNGTSLTLYKNGIAGTATTSSEAVGTSGNTTLMAGAADGSQTVDGYMSNFRAVKGTAVYTSNFTPPTAPVTAIANTSLLTNFTNAGIIDNTMLNNLETVGNAQISTAQTKFGGGSMYFDGTGDWLVVSPNVTNNLGTGNFTIEAWVYLASGSTYQFLIGATANGGMQVGLNVPISGTPTIAVGTANGSWFLNFGASISISSNTWTHIAVTRSGTTNRAFINGVQLGSNITDSTSWSFTNNTLQIGATTSVVSLNGYIDDLRITKGIARYTSNFTPATSAFPTY
jgi:hypothetical protein